MLRVFLPRDNCIPLQQVMANCQMVKGQFGKLLSKAVCKALKDGHTGGQRRKMKRK